MNNVLKLNLGSGPDAPVGWINADYSFTARLSKTGPLYGFMCKLYRVKQLPWPKDVKILDASKRFPFDDNSIDVIFSSHVLEHLSFEGADSMIKECYRCLCKDGVLRIIIPDLYKMAKKYIDLTSLRQEGRNAFKFMEELGMAEERHRGVIGLISKLFGSSRHLYMYDEWSLKEILEKYKFKNIRKMSYGQSQVPDITAVEQQHRHALSVCLECIK